MNSQMSLKNLRQNLRLICDPETVDQTAKTDQAKIIELNGGVEAVVKKGGFGLLLHRVSAQNMPQLRVEKVLKFQKTFCKNTTKAHGKNYSKQVM